MRCTRHVFIKMDLFIGASNNKQDNAIQTQARETWMPVSCIANEEQKKLSTQKFANSTQQEAALSPKDEDEAESSEPHGDVARGPSARHRAQNRGTVPALHTQAHQQLVATEQKSGHNDANHGHKNAI